jgi:RHS repeat-associated protein
MSSSMFAIDVSGRLGATAPSDIWEFFLQHFVRVLVDPLFLGISSIDGSNYNVLPGSIPTTEDGPQIDPNSLLRVNDLYKLTGRSRFLDLLHLDGTHTREIIESVQRGSRLEMWGLVSLYTLNGSSIIQDWFVAEVAHSSREPLPRILLELELWTNDRSGTCGLNFSSHSGVWDDICIQPCNGDSPAVGHKQGLDLEVAHRNVRMIVDTANGFFGDLGVRDVVWSELADGERPDRCSIVRSYFWDTFRVIRCRDQRRILLLQPPTVAKFAAFGRVLARTGSTVNDFQFTGEQYDANLKQTYLRARYYDASMGRFTRMDSYEGESGTPLTLHKFAYANADPFNNVDPTGFFASLTSTLTTIGIGLNIASFMFHQ